MAQKVRNAGKTPEEATVADIVETKVPVYTHKAFSIIEDKDGRFKMIEVDYNLETSEAKVAKVTDYARDRSLARECFKLAVVKNSKGGF